MPRFFTTKAQAGPHIGAGQSLGFTRGRGYYARPTGGGARPGTPSQPGLQPMTAGQIANAIAGYTAQLPAPMTGQQIQTEAQGQISPIIQNLTNSLAQQTKTGAGAISGYSNALAKQLADQIGQVQNIYGGAENQVAAVNAAEAEGIKGTGNDLASGLSGKLAQIGAGPAASAVALSPVTEGATGAANAAFGHGSAALDQLITDAATQGAYTAKLPGIARSQGLADINNLSQTNQKLLADQTGQIESQIPSIVQSLSSRSDTNRTNRATAANSELRYLTARNDGIYAGQSKNDTAVTVAKTKADATRYAAGQKAAAAREAAQAKASQTSFDNRLKFAKTYGYDPVTGDTLPGYAKNAHGNVVKVSAAKGPGAKKTALTLNDAVGLAAKWHDGKTVSTSELQPHTDANNNPVYRTVKKQTGQVNYQQGYKLLRAAGFDDKTARDALNTKYGRGDQGRTWLTNGERDALKKSGHQASVGYYQGHAYIAPAQLAALNKAGYSLPGELVNGRYFIKPGS